MASKPYSLIKLYKQNYPIRPVVLYDTSPSKNISKKLSILTVELNIALNIQNNELTLLRTSTFHTNQN